jgi:hypothetical protein
MDFHKHAAGDSAGHLRMTPESTGSQQELRQPHEDLMSHAGHALETAAT